MRLVNVVKVMAVGLLAFSSLAFGNERGSQDDAVSMVDAAFAHVEKVGEASAFEEFSKLDSPDWHKKDVYLFCYDRANVNTCHGANAKLIGKNLSDLKTPDGQFLIKKMNEITAGGKSGWINYDWPHPHTKKIEKKQAYIKSLPSGNGFIGAGIYQ